MSGKQYYPAMNLALTMGTIPEYVFGMALVDVLEEWDSYMGTLTRDEIFARRAALPREEVEVPELGGSVLVRVLTLKEMGEIEKARKVSAEAINMYPKVISLGCVNEDGTPLFPKEDVGLIDDLPWAALDTIATAILRINKMLPEDALPKKSRADAAVQDAIGVGVGSNGSRT
jgi:hypothetical protein